MKLLSLMLIISILSISSLSSQIPENLQNSIWQQEGYGRILKIENTTYSYYNYDTFNCSVLVEGEFRSRFEIIDQSEDLLVLNPGGVVDYRFRRLQAIPENCSAASESEINFEKNFEVFWQTFNDNYAFFEKRNLDWDQVYKEYMPVVRQLETQSEFAAVLEEIIVKFRDGHIRLEVPASISEKKEQPIEPQNPISKDQILTDLSHSYLQQVNSYNQGVIRWGKLKDSKIGYIAITDMNDFAGYVPQEFQRSDKFDSIYNEKRDQVEALEHFKDEVNGADQIMAEILDELQETKSIIVDLRFNGGGYEKVALKLLSHLVSKEKEIFSVKAKTRQNFTPLQSLSIKPQASEENKVYLLISPFTASAAEIFALGTLGYDNFQRIGSRSAGIFSELLWKKLPLGWEFSLSNEVYLDMQGQTYEGVGIPVDQELNYSNNRADFYESFYLTNSFSDPAIERIFQTEETD